MRKKQKMLTVCLLAAFAAAAAIPVSAETENEEPTVNEGQEAVYLGVENYGLEETNKDNKNNFHYRFSIDGEEKILSIDNGTQDEDGEYDYPIQNILKEGSSYVLSIGEDTVTAAEEIPKEPTGFVPAVSGTPGEKTLTNFLRTAMMPVGTTLYIYGGGWNWQDDAASVQTKAIGVSDDWVRFFEANDENFTYKNEDATQSYYPFGEYNEYYYAGLDCSGYLGWAIYNTLETEDGKDGYVTFAKKTGSILADAGWGTMTKETPDGTKEKEMRPGDIMSLNGHVWLSLGTCPDGSIVIAHSTPSDSRAGQPGGGVQISAVGDSYDCEAYALADRIMSEYYPEWSARYETALKSPADYFSFDADTAGRFTWTISDEFTDPDGLQEMSAEEALAVIFDEK